MTFLNKEKKQIGQLGRFYGIQFNAPGEN